MGHGSSRIARVVFRALSSQVVAAAVALRARVASALRNACRPSGVAGGFIADLTRSRAELIA